jgi:RNA polymerase sigma factor (sigma-70 family)
MSQPRPRVLLADDHLLVAEAIKSLLAPEFDLVGVVGDGRAMVESAATLRPDCVVADITMPLLNGIDALLRMRALGMQIPVVFLTMQRDLSFVRRALAAGGAGFILKHSASAELLSALRAALEGQTYISPQIAQELDDNSAQRSMQMDSPLDSLSPRQREVLQLLAEGMSTKQIGAQLVISPRTVEFHKLQAMESLQLHTSAELIHFALKHGLTEI